MKKISDFTGFQCSASALDQIKGGKKIDDIVYSGPGLDGTTGGCCEDFFIIYDDDSFETVFFPVPAPC